MPEITPELWDRARHELNRVSRHFDKTWLDDGEDGYKTDALYELLDAVRPDDSGAAGGPDA